jgi:3-oxoacyl-[acyl-carrier-protein] synthase II
VHAHGIGTIHGDYAEACGIADVLDSQVPVTTAKGSMGNLGAAGGAVELVASLIAIGQQRLFPIQTCEDPDPACPIRVANQQGLPAGDVVMNLNYTPHGQATAVVARGWKN